MSERTDRGLYAYSRKNPDGWENTAYKKKKVRPLGINVISIFFSLIGGLVLGFGLIGISNAMSLTSQGWSSQHASEIFMNNVWIFLGGIIIILYIYPIYEMKPWSWKYFKIVNMIVLLLLILLFGNALWVKIGLMIKYNQPLSSLYTDLFITFVIFAIFGAVFYYIYSKRDLLVN